MTAPDSGRPTTYRFRDGTGLGWRGTSIERPRLHQPGCEGGDGEGTPIAEHVEQRIDDCIRTALDPPETRQRRVDDHLVTGFEPQGSQILS